MLFQKLLGGKKFSRDGTVLSRLEKKTPNTKSINDSVPGLSGKRCWSIFLSRKQRDETSTQKQFFDPCLVPRQSPKCLVFFFSPMDLDTHTHTHLSASNGSVPTTPHPVTSAKASSYKLEMNVTQIGVLYTNSNQERASFCAEASR